MRDHASKIISQAEIIRSQTWACEDGLVIGQNFMAELEGCYYDVVIADTAGEWEEEELDRLSKKLGRPWSECVLETRRFDRPHPDMPGSTYINYYRVYGGI